VVILSSFVSFANGVVPLRKFVTLLLVPVAADEAGYTPWVKSGEVTHRRLHAGVLRRELTQTLLSCAVQALTKY